MHLFPSRRPPPLTKRTIVCNLNKKIALEAGCQWKSRKRLGSHWSFHIVIAIALVISIILGHVDSISNLRSIEVVELDGGSGLGVSLIATGSSLGLSGMGVFGFVLDSLC